MSDKAQVQCAAPVKFGLVEPGASLDRIWPSVYTYLALALAHSHQHEWTATEIYQRISSGEFLLAVAFRGVEVVGAQVFDIGVNPKGQKYVAIVCSGGKEMVSWLPGMVALGKHLAQMAGATSVVILGRRGWSRVLRQYGLRVHAVLASADVCDIDVPVSIEVVGDYRG